MDGGTWSAFWLAILGSSVNFLSIFFVCDLNSCILIKSSRVRGKGQAILSLTVMNRLDPIEELYEMYSEEEDTPRIVELVDDGLDFDSDVEGPADPYMDL